MDALPEDLARQVFTHASWSERRSDSYSRLAFLGDSVLGLAVTAHLYPRLEAERFGAGRLTKIRAQTVSGPSCVAVAERLGVPERLQAAAPEGAGRAAGGGGAGRGRRERVRAGARGGAGRGAAGGRGTAGVLAWGGGGVRGACPRRGGEGGGGGGGGRALKSACPRS